MQGLPFTSAELEDAIQEALSMSDTTIVPLTTKKDWMSDQEVRWCPGCGDYGIMQAVQTLMPELGIAPENTVFISGIGCSSRFPYYMNTYGMHSIHGRAPAIATGVAVARPDLDVWVITGDGDALSIGGNHLIHALRRNVNLTILLFNNRIYGLTKGQYSPTSEEGKVTKSTPMGSHRPPVQPAVAWRSAPRPSFVARTHDLDRKHMMEVFRQAHAHRGASFVEIFQNCNVFNDAAFDDVTGQARPRGDDDRPRARPADPLRRRRPQGRRHGHRRPAAHRRGGRRGRGRAAGARRPPRTTRAWRSRWPACRTTTTRPRRSVCSATSSVATTARWWAPSWPRPSRRRAPAT